MFSNLRHPLAVFLFDLAVSALAWAAAYALRFNLEVPAYFRDRALMSLPFIVASQASMFWAFGLYRGVWRFASIPDLQRILKSIVAGVPLSALFLLVVNQTQGVPRSVWALDTILLLMIMGGARLSYRMLKEYGGLWNPPISANATRVVLIGADPDSIAFLKELTTNPAWKVVSVVENDPKMWGRMVYGIRVEGSIDTLPMMSKNYGATHALVAQPRATYGERRKIVEACQKAGLQVLTMPSLEDLISGKVAVTQIRRFQVEDLLGRDPVVLDTRGLDAFLRDKVVMITGAAGSIGSELSRQIQHFRPSKILFYDFSEFGLYRLEQEFAELYPEQKILPLIGDVKDAERMRQVLNAHHVEVLFHAAAYKHVPLMENNNVHEVIKNNLLGTQVCAECAETAGVKSFVLISTDKAVNPTNVYGATKRGAEMICDAIASRGKMQIEIVRFGNVLDSQGSVIPRFREQIAKGGPVTITHPDIIRYFMSIPEASQLVLQAAVMGKGGEVFVLDMGEPVKILDLAKDMIRLSGLSEEEIAISYTGLRPGEKLFEELLANDENTLRTTHPKVRIAKARNVEAQWYKDMHAWIQSLSAKSEDQIKKELLSLVPDYAPEKAGVAQNFPLA